MVDGDLHAIFYNISICLRRRNDLNFWKSSGTLCIQVAIKLDLKTIPQNNC